MRAPNILLPTNEAVVLALIITEVLTNAVKYAYRGETGPIAITVQQHARSSIRITIADKGVGIASDARTTGLGSRLTQALVTQLGGSIEIKDNRPGTRVILSVPYSANTDQG